MYRVLLPLDRDVDRARKLAAAIAELPDAADSVSVTILHVFEDSDIETTAKIRDGTRIEAIRTTKEFFEERDIDVTVESRGGAIGATIINVADELDANSIVVGASKRSPTSKALLGSITQFVILNANRPVTITVDSDFGGSNE